MSTGQNPAPLDIPMVWTEFLNRDAASPMVRRIGNWRDIVNDAKHPKTFSKKELAPLQSFSEYGGTANENGNLRHAENLGLFSAVCLDYDAGEVPPLVTVELLRAHGIEALVRTTGSHRKSAPCYRVIAPLFNRCSAAEIVELTAQLNFAVGGIAASESFTPGQCWFFGKVLGVPYEYHHCSGHALDDGPSLFLDTDYGPKGKPASSTHATVRVTYPESVDSIEDLALPLTPKELHLVASAVTAMSPARADGYADWLQVLQNLKHVASRGDADFAKKLAWEFSKTCPEKANAAYFEAKWERGLHKTKGGFATLFELAKEDGWNHAKASKEWDTNNPDIAAAADDDGATSDLQISKLFAHALASENYRFEHGGRGWLRFNSGVYKRCSMGEAMERVKRVGPAIFKAASKDPDTLAKQIKIAQRAMSAAGMVAALKLAESDPRLATHPGAFDLDLDLLNVANGVVHLPSGALHPHAPGQMLSRQCAVNYEPDAPTPIWLRFLSEISNGDADWVDYMHRAAGYQISGFVNEEKLFFWLGYGANGKSVLANVLRKILANYVVTLPAGFLAVSKRDGEGATPSMASLPGARLALVNEIEAGSQLSAQTVKVACSTEQITARPLYGQPFSFTPTHKIVVRGNHRPIIKDNDHGIWRRIDLITFDRRFDVDERDMGLEEKLMIEAPGILAWMVRGFAEYRKRGLRPARRVATASAAYRKESDLLGQWVDECTGQGSTLSCIQALAYDSYRAWALTEGLHSVTKKSFTQGLAERGIRAGQETSGQRHRTYTGIRLQKHSLNFDDLFSGGAGETAIL